MKIYTETTFAFIEKCKSYVKEILNNETDIAFKKSRITYNQYTFPLNIITFVDSQKIGYFDSSNYEIGLNSNLIFSVKEPVLKDILRHELAHYITMLKHGDVLPHGKEFQSICQFYNWNKSISKASMNIELANNELTGDLKTEKMISKIKNLLRLSQSDNEHEAKLATVKANELMLKHNLERVSCFKNRDPESHEETIYIDTVYTSKKRNSKLSAIYSVLTHFLVSPVINYTSEGVRLEIAGNKTNIEIGKYIAEFLNRELDKLWAIAKYKNNLKGLKQKNSFFAGVARGFDQKMHQQNSNLSSQESSSLILIKEDLKIKTDKIYGRLRSSTSKNTIDRTSLNLGQNAGKNLTIHKGLTSTNTKKLGWFK